MNQVFDYLVLILCNFQMLIPKYDILCFGFFVQITDYSNYPRVIDLPVINLNFYFKVALIKLAK